MQPEVKKEVSLANLFLTSLPIFAGVIVAWIAITNKIASVEVEVQTMKEQRRVDRQDMREEMKELKADIKEIKTILLEDAKKTKLKNE